MKTIITVLLTILVSVPLVSYSISGLIEYQSLRVGAVSTRVAKIYDHDEGVICYVSDGQYSGGISCIKDE